MSQHDEAIALIEEVRGSDFGHHSLPDLSLWHCHAYGVASVVLKVDENGKPTHRIFVAESGCDLQHLVRFDGHFTVGVHNHRFDLSLLCLYGRMANVEFDLAPASPRTHPMWEHDFVSFQDGGPALVNPRQVGVVQHALRWMRRGDAVDMPAEALHTIKVEYEPTAWLVTEGPDRIESLCYSRIKCPYIKDERLYKQMSPLDAWRLLGDVVLERSRG